MKQVIFSTGNEAKFLTADTVCREYGIEITQNTLDIDEIQSEDAEKIVRAKARDAFKQIGQPVVVSDDSWMIPALKGFPGPYMKSINHWFTPDDFLNLTRPLQDHRIFLVAYLAYTDGNATKIFMRRQEATLLTEARGNHGSMSHKVIAMATDHGKSIAEVFDEGGVNIGTREYATIWREFAAWFAAV